MENVKDSEKYVNISPCFCQKILPWLLTNSLAFNLFNFAKPQWGSVENMINPPVSLNKGGRELKMEEQHYLCFFYSSHIFFGVEEMPIVIPG